MSQKSTALEFLADFSQRRVNFHIKLHMYLAFPSTFSGQIKFDFDDYGKVTQFLHGHIAIFARSKTFTLKKLMSNDDD